MRSKDLDLCISHVRTETSEIQTNEEHCSGVANMACRFAL